MFKSHKQRSEQVSRVHSEEGNQGVDTPSTDLLSVNVQISTTFGEAQSTGVRGLTTNPPSELSTTSSETIGRANPSLHSRTTSSPSLPITDQFTMGSTVSEGHTTNGRNHLSVHLELCWQSQPIQVKLGSLNSRTMGHSDPSCLFPSTPPSEDFVILREEIQSLLQKQAICQVPVSMKGFYSNMFTVPKKDGGQRLVINLKHQNKFVKSEYFKMEGLHTVKALWRQNDWMAKVDLKDAFFMVPIAPQHCNLLLFRLEGRTYHFKCLPFSLCTAPRVFTKILKPCVEMLKSLGIRLVIYMDDMLLMASSKQTLMEHVQLTMYLLENLGFIINSKKSIFPIPRNRISGNAAEFHNHTDKIKLPGEKIKKIRQEAHRLLAIEQPSTQLLSQLLGKLNATTPAF